MTFEPPDLSAYPVVKILEMRGETCPLPEIEAKLWLKRIAKGEVLEMYFDDPLGAEFFPKFCEKKGYPFQMTQPEDTYWHLLILKS
ncbi:MAG: sulfurtransferase TusA family protein [Planctomycetota bacterium]|jgi:TusA-related sulfurtransferase